MKAKTIKKSCGSGILAEDAPTKYKLVETLWSLIPAFTRWSESQMNEEQLTPQRHRLLILLAENGPMKMADLKDELGVTATNITALVDALESDGFVLREAHATDRRITLIKLSAKANAILAPRCTEFKDKVCSLFADFSAKDQEDFLKLLLKMRSALITKKVISESDLAKSN